MGKYDLLSDKEKYKRHKRYRWIALFFKLVSRPAIGIGFIALGLSKIDVPFRSGGQPLSTFLATFLSLVIYYSIIFILNRKRNFDVKANLKKCIAVYTLTVVLMIIIETIVSPYLQNYLYGLTNKGVNPDTGLPNSVLAYGGIGLAIQLLFSMLMGRLIFLLYRKVLSNPELLDRI